MGPPRVFAPVLGLVLALSLAGPALAAQPATPIPPEPPAPPPQPATGPGGAEYAYAEAVATRFGELPTGFWLYEPASPSGGIPAPTGPLPLVLVLPGWGDPQPLQLEAWIEHLVRRGAVVLFPNYQLAGQPIPEAAGPDLASADTLVLVAASEDDEYPELVGDDPARMFAALERVPAERRDFVVVRGDDHGRPALRAHHNVATTALYGGVDALDWYGSWKWADALMECAFAGAWCEHALGDTPEQRFMGTWSDGVPVREPLVTDDPGTATP